MSAKITYDTPKGIFFSVLSDGKFHQKVTQDTQGAVLREYETSDGTKGTKYELVAQSISGELESLSIYEGEYGKNILVALKGEKEDMPVVVSLSAQSNYGEDFMKKLPNIDVKKEVKLVPYSFLTENGKTKKGITIYQDEVKLQDYYHEENKKTKKFDPVNGYPKLEKGFEKWDSDDWKLYFGKARKVLVENFKKHELYKEEIYTVPVETGVSKKDIDF